MDFLDGEKVVNGRAEVEVRLNAILSTLEKCPDVRITPVKELLREVHNAFQSFTDEQICNVLDALQCNIFTAETYLSKFLGSSEGDTVYQVEGCREEF